MKTAKLYCLPLLLALLSLAALNSAYRTRKQTEIEAAKVAVADVKTAPSAEKSKVTDDQVITVLHQVRAFAASNHLPVEAKAEKDVIKITPVAAGTPEETKAEMLERYPQMVGFLKDVANMPSYNMQFDSYCIGEDCNGGFDVAVEVKGS